MSDPADIKSNSNGGGSGASDLSSTSDEDEGYDMSKEASMGLLTLNSKKVKAPKDFHSMNLTAIQTVSSMNRKTATTGGSREKTASAPGTAGSMPGGRKALSHHHNNSHPQGGSGNANASVASEPALKTILVDEDPFPRRAHQVTLPDDNLDGIPYVEAGGDTSHNSPHPRRGKHGGADVYAKSLGDSRNALLGNITGHLIEVGKSLRVDRPQGGDGPGSRTSSFVRHGSRRVGSMDSRKAEECGTEPDPVDDFMDSDSDSEEDELEAELEDCPNYLKGYERQQLLYRKEDLSGLPPKERVRRRLQLQLQMRETEGQALLERTKQRAHVAELKREFQESLRRQQVNGMWATIMFITLSAQRLRKMLSSAKAMRILKHRLLPMMYLKGHRLIRRARLKNIHLLTDTLQRPNFEILRQDKILKLFPEEQLRMIMEDLRPQFFVSGDVLVYQGSGGSDSFIINSGSVSITVDGKVVATLGAGAVIGTPGMVSGEPRMATVRAITDVTVWIGSKESFDRAVSQSHSQNHLIKAFEIIADMHIHNIPLLYKKALRAEGLSRFASFATVDKDRLNAVGSKFDAMFVSEGQLVVAAKTRAFTGYYVLHGSVSVEIHIPPGMSAERAYYTALSVSCDIYQTKKKHRSVLFDAVTAQLERRTKLNEPFTVVLRKIGSPVLFGIPNLLFGHPYELSVRAECSVDAMVLRREALVEGLLEDPVALNTARRLANLTRLGHFPRWYLSSQFPRGDPITLAAGSPHSAEVSGTHYPVFGGGGGAKQQQTPTHGNGVDIIPNTFDSIKSGAFGNAASSTPNVNGGSTLSVTSSNPDDCFMISRGTLDIDHQGSVGTHPYMWPSLYESYYGGFVGNVNVSTRELTCVRVRRKDIHKAMDTLHPDDRAQLMGILESAILSGRRGLMAVPEPKTFWVPESKAALAAKAGAALTATTPKKVGQHNNHTDKNASVQSINAQQPQQHLALLSNKSFGGISTSRVRIPRNNGSHNNNGGDDRNTDSAMGGTVTNVYSPALSPIPQGGFAPHLTAPTKGGTHQPAEGSTLTPVTSFRRDRGGDGDVDGAGLVRHLSNTSEDILSRKGSIVLHTGSSKDLRGTALHRKVSFKGGGDGNGGNNNTTTSDNVTVDGVVVAARAQSSQDSDSITDLDTTKLLQPHPPLQHPNSTTATRGSVGGFTMDEALMLKLPSKESSDAAKKASSGGYTTSINKLEVHDHLGRKVTCSVIEGGQSIPRFTPRRRGLTERRSEDSLLHLKQSEALEPGQQLKKHPISGKTVVFTDTELTELLRDHVPAQSPYSVENMALAQMKAKRENRKPNYAPGGGTSDNLPRRANVLETIDAAVERKNRKTSPNRKRSPPQDTHHTSSPRRTLQNEALPVWLAGDGLDSTLTQQRPSSPPPISSRKMTLEDALYLGPAKKAQQQDGHRDSLSSSVVLVETGLPPSGTSSKWGGMLSLGGARPTNTATNGRRKVLGGASTTTTSHTHQPGLLMGSILGDALNKDTQRDNRQAVANQFQSNRGAFLDLSKVGRAPATQAYSFAGSMIDGTNPREKHQLQPHTARSLPNTSTSPPFKPTVNRGALTPRAPPVAGRRAAPSWMPPTTFVASKMY